jgi:chlorite dismutase
MQLLVFECTGKPQAALDALGGALHKHAMPSVVYEDVNNPSGLGVLSWCMDPADFTSKLRPAFGELAAGELAPRHDFTMIGRSYSTGYEQDLEFWLIRRPIETALNPAWPWAVWYPLRRSGAFERLEPRERGGVLREHGEIGKSYGASDLAHDIRLACHGLDAADNEFLIGLIGKDLHPLSHVVQAMRKTRQTAEFINQMGPFFVGHAAFRNPG